MRTFTVPTLLLLLAPSLIAAADLADAHSNTASLDKQARAEDSKIVPAPQNAQTSSRPYKGTEAAPVDGLDGMPHAGPFVELTPDRAKPSGSSTTAKSVPTSLKNLKDSTKEAIPEKNDGVMNDENRPVPQQGTRGTEGGVSEKDKERKLKGNPSNKPQGPTEALPLPHSDQAQLDAHRGAGSDAKDKRPSQTKQSTGADSDTKPVKGSEIRGAEFGEGGIGLEKPTDLPEKPHNLPHPEPKNPTLPKSGTKKEDGPPVGSGAAAGRTPASSQKHGDVASEELQWHEWVHSFVLSLTMILFSEIGDKTFLIAALMAMRHPRFLVFTSAFSALITMTVLSAVLGHAVPSLLPKRFTTFAAALLFLVFGARMLREGLAMPKDMGVGEEMREVEAELEEKEHENARRARRSSNVSPYALESGRSRKESGVHRSHPSPASSREQSPAGRQSAVAGLTNLMSLVLSPAWVQTFIMTFLGEWGDRSQIATIAMAAGQDYWWVTLGAITGHACCTGVAVIGGRALAGRVSMRVVTIGGAIAFLVFGVIYLYECLGE